MKLYGADQCPDCIEAFRILDSKDINYEYVDIIKNTKTLKEFLDIRDTRDEFDIIKENSMYGIPCFIFDDGYLTFELNEVIEKYNANKEEKRK